VLGAPPPLISRPAFSTVIRHAAALSSLSAPRATILIASSGNGRCSALAMAGQRSQAQLSASA